MALTKVSRGLLSTSIVDNGNATAITIDSSENVGIGTSSPQQAIHAQGSSGTTIIAERIGSNAGFTGIYGSNNPAVVWGGSSDSLRFAQIDDTSFTNFTERMRIDSSGNVKISTSNSGNDVELRIQNSAVSSGDTATLRFSVTSNSAFDSAFVGSDRNNALILGSNAAERMRITSAGKVGIGTSSPSAKLSVSNGGVEGYEISPATVIGGTIRQLAFNRSTSNYIPLRTQASEHQFYVSSTEAMRIDASGNLLVRETSAIGAGSEGVQIHGNAGFISSGRNTTGGASHHIFYNPNGVVGNIETGGSATSYNTSSDQRLKENIADADDAGSKIDAIQVRKFDWIADGSHQDYGMVAQELQTVAPEAVSAPADPDEMMGVDYSKLVPMLVKEIQSLRARVAQLEN